MPEGEKVIDLTEKIEAESEKREEPIAVPEEKPKEPKVDPVIFALSNFSANQSYYALVGIIGWAGHEAGLLSFLFSLKKEYRNPWMQILLKSVGCCEIAGKSSNIRFSKKSIKPILRLWMA